MSRRFGKRRVVRRPWPSHWPHVMRASVVTGSYGLSSFLPVDNYHDQLSPACAIAGRLVLVAPVHPPSSRTANAAGRCRSFLNLQLSLSHRRRSALRSELCSWLFPYSCLLKAAARSFRRLPTALSFLGNPPWSIPRGGVRRYKPMLQIALP